MKTSDVSDVSDSVDGDSGSLSIENRGGIALRG